MSTRILILFILSFTTTSRGASAVRGVRGQAAHARTCCGKG